MHPWLNLNLIMVNATELEKLQIHQRWTNLIAKHWLLPLQSGNQIFQYLVCSHKLQFEVTTEQKLDKSTKQGTSVVPTSVPASAIESPAISTIKPTTSTFAS